MPLTIALSGMDSATETALRAAFNGANARLDAPFVLVPESEAEHVIVDMDSMYGPMSWLRLHAAGKQIIGLTSAPRVQTHFRLGRPFDDNAMAALLGEIARGPEAEPALQASAPEPSPAAAIASSAPLADVAPAPESEAAAPAPPPAEARPAADEAPQDAIDIPTDTSSSEPDATAHAPEVESEPEPERALPFATWIDAGVLRGRRRFRRETGPSLWLDFDAQHYHGPSTLKPLVQYFDAPVERDAFEAVDDAAWAREALAAGAAQPLLRLVWLGGLLAGDGQLAPGHDPDARYQLHKWPQTEREYPRHFRIATAMMKGPGTLDEIIAASGLPAEEVIRFVNANLATGYVEPLADTPVAAAPTEKTTGFFSRLRRR